MVSGGQLNIGHISRQFASAGARAVPAIPLLVVFRRQQSESFIRAAQGHQMAHEMLLEVPIVGNIPPRIDGNGTVTSDQLIAERGDLGRVA